MVKENKKVEVVKEAKASNNKCACNKKKLIAIIASAVVAVAGIIILIICLCGPKSNEKELKNNLKKLGAQFYEEFYYPTQEKSHKDIKEFIAKFVNTGIRVNLENIAKVSKVDKKLVDSMVNKKTKKECDKKLSYVVIKPQKPFGKTDYKVEVNLSCGFDKNKDSKSKNKNVNLGGLENTLNKKSTTSNKTTTNSTKETTKTSKK